MRLPTGGKDKGPEKAEMGAKETGKEKRRREEDGRLTRTRKVMGANPEEKAKERTQTNSATHAMDGATSPETVPH